MYLKNKWSKINIKKKIFILSTITILSSFTILYLCIYFFMPKIYESYTVSKIQSNIEELKEKLKNEDYININEILDEFSYDNNLDILLVTRDENDFINGIIYSSMRDGTTNPNKIPFLDSYDKEHFFEKYNLGLSNKEEVNPEKLVYNIKNRNETLNIQDEIYIKSLNKVYSMIIHAPVTPQTEATTIITLFFPFAVVLIVLIALAISIVYSLLISKPLIKINKVAKKIANLDFDNVIEIDGEDEIGELSNSLNLMNKNLKESFEELEIINATLEEEIEIERRLERERREFIAAISHELKSPITIISGQLEGMIYNIGKYKDRDKYLSESYDVTKKMSELVQEILGLSEREDGNFNYKFEDVNISSIINEVLWELKYFIDEKKLLLESTICDNIIINADRKLIKKVISNIIKNAIIYSPDREKVIVTLSKEEFKVENTGVSIPEDEINEVFNAFYRVDKSRNRKTGGTGLGLYIVKTVLDKHNNLIYNINSTENSVIFTIKFNIE